MHNSVERKYDDKKFGSALAVWDRLFDSLLLSKTENITGFGLDKKRSIGKRLSNSGGEFVDNALR